MNGMIIFVSTVVIAIVAILLGRRRRSGRA
jgi:hypothetical protein